MKQHYVDQALSERQLLVRIAGSAVDFETTADKVSTATLSSLASGTSSAQLIAANTARKGLIVQNTDVNALFIKYGTTATTAIGGFTAKINTDAIWEMPAPIYTGRVDAIWAGDGSGGAAVTEL